MHIHAHGHRHRHKHKHKHKHRHKHKRKHKHTNTESQTCTNTNTNTDMDTDTDMVTQLRGRQAHTLLTSKYAQTRRPSDLHTRKHACMHAHTRANSGTRRRHARTHTQRQVHAPAYLTILSFLPLPRAVSKGVSNRTCRHHALPEGRGKATPLAPPRIKNTKGCKAMVCHGCSIPVKTQTQARRALRYFVQACAARILLVCKTSRRTGALLHDLCTCCGRCVRHYLRQSSPHVD